MFALPNRLPPVFAPKPFGAPILEGAGGLLGPNKLPAFALVVAPKPLGAPKLEGAEGLAGPLKKLAPTFALDGLLTA